MDKLWFLAEVEILQNLAPADLEQIAARAPMQSEVRFILKRGRIVLLDPEALAALAGA